MKEKENLRKVLWVYPGPVPPPADPARNKHVHLSEICTGDILLPVWWKREEEKLEKLNCPIGQNFTAGNFVYHFFYLQRFPAILQGIARLIFFISAGLKLKFSGNKSYDFVICYGTNSTGLAAAFLSALFGAKLVVEIPGTPSKAYIYDEQGRGLGLRIKKGIADLALNLVLSRTDHLRMLYPTQLAAYPRSESVPRSIFHEFVPTSLIPASSLDEKYIFFLGSPYYLKGVDTLIKAFLLIQDEFPEYRLKVVGHSDDRSYFEQLAAGSSRIEFHPGVPYPRAIELMAKCSVFVLPSRTEAMGCVLLEAFASQKAAIGSNVDGIPHYVEDEVVGLLFSSENEHELANQLRRCLVDSSLRNRLAQAAKRRVDEFYSERIYVERFRRIFELCSSQ